MQELTGILANAAADVGETYFKLPIAESDPVFRERVYCYELYHQIRCRWPEHTPYFLNGEVDKNGHSLMARLGFSYEKPDLLVHIPGNPGGNHAVIEVKKCDAPRTDIVLDLFKLALFVTNAGYQRAICWVYGPIPATLVDDLSEAALHHRLPTIELWNHACAGREAQRLAILGG